MNDAYMPSPLPPLTNERRRLFSCRRGLRSTPRKPFIFRFDAQTRSRSFPFSPLQRRRGLRLAPRKPFILRFDAQTRSRDFRFPLLQRRRGLRSAPRKPFVLRFDAQTRSRSFPFFPLQRRHGLRSAPRKPFILRFDAQTRSRNFFFPLAAAPARFALGSPQTLYFPFLCANPVPGAGRHKKNSCRNLQEFLHLIR